MFFSNLFVCLRLAAADDGGEGFSFWMGLFEVHCFKGQWVKTNFYSVFIQQSFLLPHWRGPQNLNFSKFEASLNPVYSSQEVETVCIHNWDCGLCNYFSKWHVIYVLRNPNLTDSDQNLKSFLAMSVETKIRCLMKKKPNAKSCDIVYWRLINGIIGYWTRRTECKAYRENYWERSNIFGSVLGKKMVILYHGIHTHDCHRGQYKR